MGSPNSTIVGQTQTEIITHPKNLGFQILAEKVHPPSSEIKLLRVWWKGGTMCVHPKTLASLEQIEIPGYKKELQCALALLVIWRKHILAFSIIACPHNDLTHQMSTCDWTPVHAEFLKLLIFKARLYQVLRPMHPTVHFISNGALQFMFYQCICGNGDLRVQLALSGFICTALKTLFSLVEVPPWVV